VEQLLRTLPLRVKVGAYDYRLVLSEDWGPDGEDTWGHCDANTYVIHVYGLRHAPNPEFVVGVVIHEILHAVWDERHLGKRPDEEKVVSRLEVGLLSLFRDNPKLINWIKKGLK
jgi:hypothetical protein